MWFNTPRQALAQDTAHAGQGLLEACEEEEGSERALPLATLCSSSCPRGTGVLVCVTVSCCAQSEHPLIVNMVLGVILSSLPSGLGTAGSPQHPPAPPAAPTSHHLQDGLGQGCVSRLPLPQPRCQRWRVFLAKSPEKLPFGSPHLAWLSLGDRAAQAGWERCPRVLGCGGAASCSCPWPRPRHRPLQETPHPLGTPAASPAPRDSPASAAPRSVFQALADAARDPSSPLGLCPPRGSEPGAGSAERAAPPGFLGCPTVTYAFKCVPDFCSTIYFFAILAQV